MSSTTRYFQMLGSLVAQISTQAERESYHRLVGKLVKGKRHVGKAYTGALNEIYHNAHARVDAEHKLIAERAKVLRGTRPTLELVRRQAIRPYAVGDTFRPKRANQHSKPIVVKAVENDRVYYSRGNGAGTSGVSMTDFAALIGRKLS